MKKLTSTVITALGLLLLVGCGNKGGGTPESVSPAYGYNQWGQYGCLSNCDTGGVYTGFIAQGTATSPNVGFGSPLTLSAQIYGDQAQINMILQYGQKPFIAYSGPVSMTGQLNVTQPIYLQGTTIDPYLTCQIPPGPYTLIGNQGISNGGITYQFMNVIGNGPRQITANIKYILSDMNGDGIVDRLNPSLELNAGSGGYISGCIPRVFLLN
ncbi:MAG: hypothetical protein V4736_07325 [Bdellovibrionota bacterium]